MTMTLEQVRDWHREMERLLAKAGSMSAGASRHKAAADAIDAHLTQPAQSVDVEKVREVIAKLNIELGESDRFSRIRVSTVRFYLKKLTVALQEKGNG